MANSGTVTAGSAALASQYNNLRADVLNITTGHTHTGASENGAKVAATGVSSGTAALGAVLSADGSGGASFAVLAAAGADVQEFTSSGSWVKPAGKSAVFVFALGGGGGGATGARTVSNGNYTGGFGGGPGLVARHWLQASDLAGTVTVTIGSGGNGGTCGSASANQNGVNGSAGGNTSFGSAIVAVGGDAGSGRTATDTGTTEKFQYHSGLLMQFANRGDGRFAELSAGTALKTSSTFPDPVYFPVQTMNDNSGTQFASAENPFTGAPGGAGGQSYNGAGVAYNGAQGGRGFGMRLDAVALGGVANSATSTRNGAAAGTAGIGNGGGGGGGVEASEGDAGNGGAGHLGGGGGGGGASGANSGTSRRPGQGGAGGGGYILVISV